MYADLPSHAADVFLRAAFMPNDLWYTSEMLQILLHVNFVQILHP